MEFLQSWVQLDSHLPQVFLLASKDWMWIMRGDVLKRVRKWCSNHDQWMEYQIHDPKAIFAELLRKKNAQTHITFTEFCDYITKERLKQFAISTTKTRSDYPLYLPKIYLSELCKIDWSFVIAIGLIIYMYLHAGPQAITLNCIILKSK
jgi:hypothetical protein